MCREIDISFWPYLINVCHCLLKSIQCDIHCIGYLFYIFWQIKICNYITRPWQPPTQYLQYYITICIICLYRVCAATSKMMCYYIFARSFISLQILLGVCPDALKFLLGVCPDAFANFTRRLSWGICKFYYESVWTHLQILLEVCPEAFENFTRSLSWRIYKFY